MPQSIRSFALAIVSALVILLQSAWCGAVMAMVRRNVMPEPEYGR